MKLEEGKRYTPQEIREIAGIDKWQLSLMLGWTKTAYSRKELGKQTRFFLEDLEKLAKFYNISIYKFDLERILEKQRKGNENVKC